MAALLAALIFVQANLVAVRPQSGARCPSSLDVEAALLARVPGAVVTPARAEEREALVLELVQGEQGASALQLVDNRGRVQLRRSLETTPGERDCAALAETAALIVQRYLSELDYQPADRLSAAVLPAAPPPIGPDRRWDLSLTTAWRTTSQGWGAFELGGRVARLLGRHGHVLLALGVAAGGEADPVPSATMYPGEATLRHMPIDLGLWWRRSLGAEELQVGAGGLLDITQVRSHAAPDMKENRTLPGPGAWVAAALRIPVGHLFLRTSASVVGSALQYDFSYQPGPRDDQVTVFSAPTRRFYVKLLGEVGVPLH